MKYCARLGGMNRPDMMAQVVFRKGHIQNNIREMNEEGEWL